MKHVNKLFIALLIISLFFIISCSTIIKGTKQDIPINSNPAKATLVVKTMGGVEVYNGVTPTAVKLSKKEEYAVTISLSGYKDATVHISQEFEPWFLGNILCGGLIGMIIDAVDGAMWKLEPNQIMISLNTASNGTFDTREYVIFRALDKDGQLRSLAVPLVKDNSLSSN